MLLVHIAYLGMEVLDAPADAFRRLARQHGVGQHALTADPSKADCLLFTQPHMLGSDWRLNPIVLHPLVKQYPAKTLVYDERDRPFCSFPGVYTSVPRQRLNSSLQRAW